MANEKTEPPVINEINKKKFKVNENIANWLDEKAKIIDIALAGKQYTERSSNSSASITQELFWNELDDVKYRVDLDLDLSLPNFEDKYKLMFSNYNRNRVRRSNYSRGNFRQDRSNDYGATLSFLEKVGDFDITFEPRLQLSGGFGTFYNLRVENKYKLSPETSNLKVRFEFFADSIRGTGQFTALTFEHTFSKSWAFSLVLEEEYQDAENIFILLQGLNFFHKINSKMFLNQSLIFSSSNRIEARGEPIMKESFRLQEITLGPSFTHEILKDEIHYSLNYNYIWNREQDFEGYNSASLIVSLIF